jgi:hypothetical protein
MIKILNHAGLYSKLQRYARNIGVADFTLERQGNFTYIGAKENIFKTDSDTDVIRLIFGPFKASQIHGFDKPTAEILEAVLPIPMWVWGWDSI